VSAPGFRFSDPSRHPTTAETLRRSIGVVRALSCNVLITVHPDFSGVLDKAAANAHDPSKNAFLDSQACRAYADDADKRLDAKLTEERSAPAPNAAR
jgi:metallo-beta-lactamase class B